jgi:hypothetical protein
MPLSSSLSTASIFHAILIASPAALVCSVLASCTLASPFCPPPLTLSSSVLFCLIVRAVVS